MASTSARRWSSGTLPAQIVVFPDEILEEIFLRLDAAPDLARASAACSSFRRIVSERRFLRRFRSLHSPAILGFISRAGHGHHEFLPVRPPHRWATEARALVQAADFTFSLLPDPLAWRSHHARDGLVLLSRRISVTIAFDDLVVWTPCIAADENDEEESFRVFCPVYHRGSGKIMAFVFSSRNQTWQGIISTIHLPNEIIRYKPFYAHGCFYWTFHGKSYYSLMLDTSEMKFSTIDLPPHKFNSPHAIVEAEQGRLGFLNFADGTIELSCNNGQGNGIGAQEWLHNKLVPLPKEFGIDYRLEILGTAGRYLALAVHQVICDDDESHRISEHYVLDIKTMLIEKLCTSNNGPIYGYLYARFPPPLALPSI